MRCACPSAIVGLLIVIPVVSGSQTSALPPLTPPLAITAADYAARRAAVTAKVDSGIILAFGESSPLDYFPPFYQLPNFEYLTGFDETDATLLILKRPGKPT